MICSNAIKYNEKKIPIYRYAKQLQSLCKQWFEVLPKSEMELWGVKKLKKQQKKWRFFDLHKEVDNEIPKSANLDICILKNV